MGEGANTQHVERRPVLPQEDNDMKTQSFMHAVLLTVSLFYTSYSLGQSNVVFYGTNASSIRVSFVDTNLSASTQSAIVSDLQVCLHEWGKRTELILGADEPDLAGYLYNFKTNPHYPEDIAFPEGVTNTPAGLALQIPKVLSDAYTNAFAFAAANSNAVAAAYEFVAYVTGSNFLSTVTSNTIHNYLLVKGMPCAYYQSEFEGIVEGLLQYPKYCPPSLLGFYCSPNGPGPSNLYFILPAKTNPGYGYDEWHSFPTIWHDNRWKICLGYECLP